MGNKPFLMALDCPPAHEALITYTIGRLGSISPPHGDALQHKGLCPVSVRRLLGDVILTTVLLHKRHAVPSLPVADHFSPLTVDSVHQSLVNSPPPEWYHVAN